MTDLSKAVSAEFLKLKRTLAVRLAVAAPLAVVLLNFFIYSQGRGADTPGANPLIGFAQINFTMWTILVLPLYVALAAALVAGVDHQSNGWKQMLALPVSRQSVFASKWMAAAALVLLSAVVFAFGISIAALVLRAIRPTFRSASIPAGLVTLRSLQTFGAACLIVSIHTWVSLRYRTFIAGLGLGIGGVFILLGGVARSGLGTFIVYVYPWALPPTAMARMWETHADRWFVTAWGIVAGTLIAILGSWRLSRRDSV